MQVHLPIWEFPISIILSMLYIAGLFVISGYSFQKQKENCSNVLSKVVEILGGRKFSGIIIALSAVMIAIDGTWNLPLEHSVPFVVVMFVLMTSVGLVILRRARTPMTLKNIAFMANHIGFFFVLFAGFFGAADVEKARIAVYDEPNHIAYSVGSADPADDGLTIPLKFDITLERFNIDCYPGTDAPRQFTSDVRVTPIDGSDTKTLSTRVNHPAYYGGYRIYQDSYTEDYSVLLLVRDKWIPLVWIGFILLTLGSILTFYRFYEKYRMKFLIPFISGIALLFAVVFIFTPGISSDTPMPALVSGWFLPHVSIYIFAYVTLAIALVCSIANFFIKNEVTVDSLDKIVKVMVFTGSTLLLIGMVSGSVWAKQAWGDWWAWDAKENWAAVTWLITLVYVHLRKLIGNRFWNLIILILAFAAIQVTWYGVKYLPSSEGSMHTYTTTE